MLVDYYSHAILIASLGAVVDMSMSIATTLEELVYHNPNISRAILFKSGIKNWWRYDGNNV